MLKIVAKFGLILSLSLIFFPIKSNASINAASYGMKCNGITDDTVAFQNAVNAAAGNELVLPSGTCLISGTVKFGNGGSRGIKYYHLRGAGPGDNAGWAASTSLLWTGTSTTIPMILISGVKRSVFEGFNITNQNSINTLAVAIQSDTGNVVNGGETGGNEFKDIVINGTDGFIGKGFAFVVGPGGTDTNNDTSLFLNVSVFNFKIAGWSFEHSQSKSHIFVSCHFSGTFNGTTPTNQYGVTTALGASNQGGSFLWYGGQIGQVSADFYLGAPNDAIGIFGANSEGSGRLLDTSAGGGASTWPITIESVRWAANQLNADGNAIIYSWAGPLNLIGNMIGDIGNGSVPNLRIEMTSWGYPNPQIGNAIGNNIFTTLSQPFVVQRPAGSFWHLKENTITNGLPALLPDSTPPSYSATPSNPAGNVSTTVKMAGLSSGTTVITPFVSGTVSFHVEGTMSNGKASSGCAVQLSQGTGSGPANGAAVTGTQIGRLLSQSNANTAPVPFELNAIASGLTLGTPVWMDVTQAAVGGGTCVLSNLYLSAQEQ